MGYKPEIATFLVTIPALLLVVIASSARHPPFLASKPFAPPAFAWIICIDTSDRTGLENRKRTLPAFSVVAADIAIIFLTNIAQTSAIEIGKNL
ncbi:MAG: hypothetical protein FJ149_06310 [Euryarchaeota archaeon]|nr:hypothetical protein [Euryarchaeota archaeon]